MVQGKRHAAHQAYLMAEEDDWERHSRLMAKLHEGHLIISHSLAGGEQLKEDAFKEPDHFNDWLRAPGVIMPEHERHALEQEVLAEQKAKKAAALEALAKKEAAHGGNQKFN
jgi:hypothetical protein